MTGERRRFSHPILFRVLAIGLGLLVAVAAFEVAVRFVPFGGSLGPRWVQIPGEPQPLRAAIQWGYEPTPWFGKYQDRGFSQRSQLVPFTVVACDTQTAREGEPTCRNARHNSSGFRTSEFTIAHPPDTFRIVIVGDSFTWGDGVEQEQTYHRVLQGRFDRERGSAALKVEIVALGVNGSSFPDNVTRLLTFGERLQPDLVLVQFFDNDLQYRATQDLLIGADNASYADFLMETTTAGRLLRDRLQLLKRSDKWMVELERAYDPASQEWGIFQSVLSALEGWRSKRGVPVAFLSFPDVDTNPRGRNYNNFKYPPPTFELLSRVEREVEKRKFPLVRVLETFRARAGNQFLAVSAKNAHFGPFANQLAADAVFDFLTRADWIDLATGRPRPAGDAWAAERALRDKAAADWAEYFQSAERQRELFIALLKQHPDDPWILQDLARLNRVEARFDECRAGYERLGQIRPEFAAPWFHMSLCTDGVTEREGLLMRMLDAVPDHPAATHSLAALDENEGRVARSCGCYQRAMEVGTSPQQTRAVINAAKRLDCQNVKVEPCPGRDPLSTHAP